MPSATTTKSAMAGTKRKSAPGKDSHKKDTKKAKTEKEPYVKKPKVKSAPPVKKVQEPTSEEEDFDSDIDSDGGAPIGVKDIDLEDQEDEDEEDLPKASDGLHPERAKAVVINSEHSQLQFHDSMLTLRRSIFEGSTCQAKAISKGTKGRKTVGRRSCPNEEDLGTITTKIPCPKRGEKGIGHRVIRAHYWTYEGLCVEAR